jgi:hypothetical protein
MRAPRAPNVPAEPRSQRPSGPPVAALAVEDPPPELGLQVGLHLEQLEAEHLRLEDWAVFGEFAGLELADPVPAITRNAPPSARSVIRGSAIGSTKSSGRSPRARSSACRSRRIRHRRAKKETITSLAMLETTSWTGDKTQTLSTAVSVETPA